VEEYHPKPVPDPCCLELHQCLYVQVKRYPETKHKCSPGNYRTGPFQGDRAGGPEGGGWFLVLGSAAVGSPDQTPGWSFMWTPITAPCVPTVRGFVLGFTLSSTTGCHADSLESQVSLPPSFRSDDASGISSLNLLRPTSPTGNLFGEIVVGSSNLRPPPDALSGFLLSPPFF